MTTSGIDLTHVDETVRAADDLYRHVNGRWIDSYVIPADRAQDGALRELFDQAERDVRAIIDEAAANPKASGNDALIGTLYRSFMDTERIEQLGTSPLRAELDLVAAADTPTELAQAMGQLQRAGVRGAFGAWVDTDPADPDRYVVNLTQGGLGLPDEAYYREESFAPIREQYLTHIASMFALVSDTGPTERAPQAADDVMALETALASAHWDVVEDRDTTKTYNPMTLAELMDKAPGFPWKAWAKAIGAPDGSLDSLVVREPSYFEFLAEQWKKTPLATWRTWLTWRTVSSRAALLNEAVVAENFDFYGRTLTGAQEMRERWKRGVSLVQGALGEAIGERYVAAHFPPAAKERMQQLVANLIEAYRQSITALTWMTEGTKAKALEKLDQFTPKIGYPDRWRDYSALTFTEGDLIGNVRASSQFEWNYEFSKLGGPVDRGEWFMTPQTVNAYYNPGMNEIVFPAAILQPPFFSMDADDAANYGGIGAVIGHEIGHGFDDQGSKYDGRGKLTDWWTEADRTEFEARTKALIDQYDAFHPSALDGDEHVNGALTIGENIGDLGGLGIAIKAYRIALGGKPAPEIDGMSGLQRLFFGWAQAWRVKTRPEEVARRLAVDPHSPEEFRCNGVVSNLDDFYEAFDVQESDALYLPPDQRVSIW